LEVCHRIVILDNPLQKLQLYNKENPHFALPTSYGDQKTTHTIQEAQKLWGKKQVPVTPPGEAEF
jgi:hypothetical protein